MIAKNTFKICLITLIFFTPSLGHAWSQIISDNFPEELMSNIEKGINNKSKYVVSSLCKRTEKVLNKLEVRENRIKNILFKQDTLTSAVLLDFNPDRYKKMQQQLTGDNAIGSKTDLPSDYMAYADTLQTGLKFLLTSKSTVAKGNTQAALTKLNQSLTSISNADQITASVKERCQQLNEITSRYKTLPGKFKKEINGYSKDLFYYNQQVEEAKDIFRDPDYAEKRAIKCLKKIPGFEQWMEQNGQLSNLFGSSTANITSNSFQLQTVESTKNLLYTNLGTNAAQLISQQMQQAQSQMNELKQKLTAKLTSGTASLPDGSTFKPNSQKTKPFFKRFERTFNLQTVTKSGNFPVVNDLGVGIGYKVNDRSVVGVGASYKFGLGQSIQKVKWSSEGIGLRTYLDIKWKGSLWLTGGYERDYYQRFSTIQDLQSVVWTQSALLGLTKKVKLRKKEVKIQILYDFLREYSTSRNIPILFRYGWSF